MIEGTRVQLRKAYPGMAMPSLMATVVIPDTEDSPLILIELDRPAVDKENGIQFRYITVPLSDVRAQEC